MRTETEIIAQYEQTKRAFDSESQDPRTTRERLEFLKRAGIIFAWILDDPNPPEWVIE